VRITFCLARAAPHLDLARWGELYDEGLAALVAHYLVSTNVTTGGGAAVGGALSGLSKTVGDVTVSRSFAVSAKAGDDPLLETPYGKTYRALARMVGMGAVAV
jgi:hypothetical protein